MLIRLALLLPLLAACAPVVPEAPGTPAGDACGAGQLAGMEGIPLEELAFVPVGIVRVIRPGDAVTMDFNDRRLNLALDAQDRLERAYCG